MEKETNQTSSWISRLFSKIGSVLGFKIRNEDRLEFLSPKQLLMVIHESYKKEFGVINEKFRFVECKLDQTFGKGPVASVIYQNKTTSIHLDFQDDVFGITLWRNEESEFSYTRAALDSIAEEKEIDTEADFVLSNPTVMQCSDSIRRF